MSKSAKIYELYPTRSGYSGRVLDYKGRLFRVLALSAKQAHYCAENNLWFSGTPGEVGVVERYVRDGGPPGDHLTFCGCQIFFGVGLRHGMSARQVQRCFEQHTLLDHGGF